MGNNNLGDFMSNSVIRRVDMLGRIVIPIHLRKSLNLVEDDNVEIYLNTDNELVVRKYSTIQSNIEIIQQVADTLKEALSTTILIVDMEQIIYSSGQKDESYIEGSKISQSLIKNIESFSKGEIEDTIIESKTEELNVNLYPLKHLKPIGAIIAMKKELSLIEVEVLKSYCSFLEKMLKG